MSRFLQTRGICRFGFALALMLVPVAAEAQAAPPLPADSQTGGRLILVLPFDNRSGQPALNWIGDSFPETFDHRLTSAGFLTITRDDRRYALDHLGLPTDFRPTRATTIRIAQTLDANFVIVGSFNVVNGQITVQAQVLEVNRLRLSPATQESNALEHLFDVENALAWKVARQIDPSFNVAEQTFVGASAGISLSAFENYIRGLDATTPEERLKRLQAAADTTPIYPPALLALGKEQYAQRDFDGAAATLAKVPSDNRLALEASFYLGLAHFNSVRYAQAESAFAFVASRLPLPEVVNNQGVAAARQGKDASPFFQRASTADPSDADYHYNLAVSLYRRGDLAGATREVNEALRLRSSDSEATDLKTRLATGVKLARTDAFAPLERIRRTYSEASFRQAAFQLDQMRALRMTTLPPIEQAAQYTQLGGDYLNQGLIPEAEQEFQSAIAADSNNAPAHAGLARVREQSGDIAAARSEARASLRIKANADAYLVLARLDLQGNQLQASADDVRNALRLEPNNTAAQGMRQTLISRGQNIP